MIKLNSADRFVKPEMFDNDVVFFARKWQPEGTVLVKVSRCSCSTCVAGCMCVKSKKIRITEANFATLVAMVGKSEEVYECREDTEPYGVVDNTNDDSYDGSWSDKDLGYASPINDVQEWE